MKVLVVGANGQVGRHFIQILANSEQHTPKAMVRKEEQISFFNALGVQSVVVSLEESVEEIMYAMDDCDAVVFTAGSGAETGADKTLLIDLDGAAKTIEAAKETNTSRFLMVSAIHADRRENWTLEMAPYYVAKHHADNILRGSGLTYTIVRPGLLKNDPGTGKVKIGDELDSGAVPREDVAKVLVHCLDNKSTYNRTFDLVSGEDEIEEALKKL